MQSERKKKEHNSESTKIIFQHRFKMDRCLQVMQILDLKQAMRSLSERSL
jgi:hypothetical protein